MIRNNMLNNTLALLLLCSTALLSACFEDKAAQAPQKRPPTPVVLQEIKKESVPIVKNYMGKALGFLTVDVRAQISGILLKKFYKEGEYVKKGQLLFEIDPSQPQALLNQAEAKLAQARANYNNANKEWKRILPLYNKNAVSQKDRDQAEAVFLSAKADIEVAQANVNNAKIQLGYTKVVAPISGYTSLDTYSEGNLIGTASSLLTTINQVDPMYIVFSFTGAEIAELDKLVADGKAEMITEGAPVSITLLDGTPYSHKGKITFIDTQIDPLTNSLQAKAEFPNPEGFLIPNMFTNVTVTRANLKDVLLIPQEAVLQTGKGPMVYTANKENIVQLTPVVLGEPVNSKFIVNSGLKVGDRIVVEGAVKIFPGAAVMPIPANAGATPPQQKPEQQKPATEQKPQEKKDNSEKPLEETKTQTPKAN